MKTGENLVPEAERPKDIIVYGRPNCPMVRPVLKALIAAQAAFDYVDIIEDENARRRVQDINNGNETVPTLVFPDGGTLSEPGPNKLRSSLRAAGYDVAWFTCWRPFVVAALGNPVILLVVAGVAVIVRIILRMLGVL
jgi:mycoredoxin